MLQISWAALGGIIATLAFIYTVLDRTLPKKDKTSGVIATFQKFLDNLMKEQRRTVEVQQETAVSLRALTKITEKSHDRLNIIHGVNEYTNGVVIDNKTALATVETKVDGIGLAMAELKGSKRK